MVSKQPECWSRTGAPALHPSLEHWLEAHARTTHRASQDWQQQHWWTPVWAEGELYAHFPAEAVTAVLSVRRDGQTWEQATRLSVLPMKTVITLERQMAAMCRQLARTTYL
jgi:hypothetical protein